MTLFSANLGFLWTELSLPDAIRAAKKAGFDAVECHWPYTMPSDEINAALEETGLAMLGLNTGRGASGENGLAAMPGRETEARALIDQALAYASAIRTPNVHVMAGFAQGEAANTTFISNLAYACEKAAPLNITILIEPLNHYDAPGYALQTTAQAKTIIDQVNEPNLRLMFDCYHVQLMEGDVCNRLSALMPVIGHIQIAGVPNRAEPDQGELDYTFVMNHLRELGYAEPIGAEYRPTRTTNDSLDWMKRIASAA